MQKRIAKLLKMQPPLITNPGLLFASGDTVPVDGTVGYQTGCLFQNTSGGAGTSLYVNEGDYSACDFDALPPVDTQFIVGTSGTHVTDATVGGSTVGVFVDPTAATTAIYETVRAESLLSTQTVTVSPGGVYTGRFVAGVKAGATFKGAAGQQSYVTGIQGKLTLTSTSVLGDGTSGGIYAQAVLAQMQISSGATVAADDIISGLWVDNQVGASLAGAAQSQLLNLTNNGGAIQQAVHMYGNNALTRVLSLETMGSAIVPATAMTGTIKVLVIAIDGTPYYIPCYSTHT